MLAVEFGTLGAGKSSKDMRTFWGSLLPGDKMHLVSEWRGSKWSILVTSTSHRVEISDGNARAKDYG